MVLKAPVGVNWQTLFAIFPIIGLFATWRIEKLRLYLLIIIVFLVSETLIEIAIFGFDSLDPEQSDMGNSEFQTVMILLNIGVSMFFVRKWSIEWNEKSNISKTSSYARKLFDNTPPKSIEDENRCKNCNRLLSAETENDICQSCKNQENLSSE